MLVAPKHKALLLSVRNPASILAVLPKGKMLEFKRRKLLALPHTLDTVKTLGDLSIRAPSPILHYYKWPRNHTIANPFVAQAQTAAFLTLNDRAYVLNGLGCISGDATLSANRCGKTFKITLRSLYRKFHYPHWRTDTTKPWTCRSLMGDRFGLNVIEDVLYQGEKPTLRITLEDGKQLRCTPDHRVMIPGGWVEAGQLAVGDTLVTNGRVMVACPQCGKEREVNKDYVSRARKKSCRECKHTAHSARMAGADNPSWKGGRYVDADGYVMVYNPTHHRAYKSGHVCEHILVAEEATGKPVLAGYHVHHINGIKHDNRAENLEVLLPGDHYKQHNMYVHLDGGSTINGGQVVILPRYTKVVKIEDGGTTDVYDLVMQAPHHNFVVNGVVVHNSGKTIASLWAYDYLRTKKQAKKLLVIAPLSTIDLTWADGIFEHFSHLSSTVLHHNNRAKRIQLLEQDSDVYITNHDGAKILWEAINKRPDIDTIIVDELAQCARNAQTDMWKALNLIVNAPKLNRRAWGLTATPMPNLPTDVWAQAKLITPDTVPKYFTRFRDTVLRQQGPYLWLPRDNATEIAHAALQPSIRYSREECVDLPPTTYTERHVDLTAEQQKAYKAMLTKLKAEVASGQITASNEAVKAGKLTQIACGVAYDEGKELVQFPCKPRLAEVEELINESQSKTIVFAPFVSVVHLIADHLTKAGYSVEMIYGDVSKTKRHEIFSAFQRYSSPQVIVAQPSAMSHGLTLTAASTIIWYAPITSADTYGQANGRITRPGQKHNTLIVHISGTPEERKMFHRLKNKERMQGILLDLVVQARAA